MVFREGTPVTDHVQAIIELRKGYHTLDDLRRIANAIYPESYGADLERQLREATAALTELKKYTWDRVTITHQMPTYVLRETNSAGDVPGGLCLVCGALIPNDGLIRHAAWHNRLERGNGR